MRLQFGPYRAPALKIGDTAHCAIRGYVIVTDFTDAPIRWPRGHRLDVKNVRGVIVVDDLLRALQCEMGQVIAQAWGVSPKSVTAWRHALKIDGRGLEARRDHLSRNAVAPPPHALTRRQQAKAVARSLEVRRDRGELWTPEEESLLGTDTDRAIAEKLNRPLMTVRSKRLLRGLAPVPDHSLRREHARRLQEQQFGVRYAVRWDLVLEHCRQANTSLADLAAMLQSSRSTISRRFPCGDVLWRSEWIQAASRYFGISNLLVHRDFTHPVNYARATTGSNSRKRGTG